MYTSGCVVVLNVVPATPMSFALPADAPDQVNTITLFTRHYTGVIAILKRSIFKSSTAPVSAAKRGSYTNLTADRYGGQGQHG